jgi:hypothetical protein
VVVVTWNHHSERLAVPVEHIICFFLLCNRVTAVITEFIQAEQSSLHLHYLSVHICFVEFPFQHPWQTCNFVSVWNTGLSYQFWINFLLNVTHFFLIFEKTGAMLHIERNYVDANGKVVIVILYTLAYNIITHVSYQFWCLNFWFVTFGGVPGNSLFCIFGRLTML